MRFFTAVHNPHVTREIPALTKPLVTQVTPVGFLPCVQQAVLVQCPLLVECFAAVIALVRLFSGVSPHVQSQVLQLGEGFITQGTLVRSLPCVRALVHLQACKQTKCTFYSVWQSVWKC